MFDSEQSFQAKPDQVQPDQQFGERVQQLALEVRVHPTGEQRPVGQRESQVLGDQRGVQWLAVRGHPVGHHTDGLHDRDPHLGQLAQQFVLVVGQSLADFLDGIDDPADPHEADDVPGDATRQRDQLLFRPLRQRGGPGQHQQIGGVGAGGELHAHDSEPRTANR